MRAVVAVAACLLMIPFAGAFPGAGLGAPVRDAGVPPVLANTHDQAFGDRLLLAAGDTDDVSAWSYWSDFCFEETYAGPAQWSLRHEHGADTAEVWLESPCFFEHETLNGCQRDAETLRCQGSANGPPAMLWGLYQDAIFAVEEVAAGGSVKSIMFDVELDITTGTLDLYLAAGRIEGGTGDVDFADYQEYQIADDDATITFCDRGGPTGSARAEPRCYADGEAVVHAIDDIARETTEDTVIVAAFALFLVERELPQ